MAQKPGISNVASKFPVIATSPQKKHRHQPKSTSLPHPNSTSTGNSEPPGQKMSSYTGIPIKGKMRMPQESAPTTPSRKQSAVGVTLTPSNLTKCSHQTAVAGTSAIAAQVPSSQNTAVSYRFVPDMLYTKVSHLPAGGSGKYWQRSSSNTIIVVGASLAGNIQGKYVKIPVQGATARLPQDSPVS